MSQINQIWKRELVIQTKKIPNTSGLVKKTDCNTKISEVESKISSISGLVTTSALNADENKITDVNNLLKKKIL